MEVEGKEIGTGYENKAVDEADEQGGDVGAVREDTQRHHRVGGEFPFVEEEEGDRYEAEDNEAHDCGRGPRVADAAVFEAEEEHYGAAGDCDDTDPINRF